MSILLSISRILISILFCIISSTGQTIRPNASCSSSSCGSIGTISYPFRLRGEPRSCGYNHPAFELYCNNNQTVLRIRSRIYNVLEINYNDYSIRLVDPNINSANLSSCPVYSNTYDDWPSTVFSNLFEYNVPVAFIHCMAPVTSSGYVNASFCGNRSNVFSRSLEIYSYVYVGSMMISELEESCTIDRVEQASSRRAIRDNSSLASIYEGLGYGFELSWFRVLCGECERTHGFCSLEGSTITCRHYCPEGVPLSQLGFRCQFRFWGTMSAWLGSIALGGLMGIRFIIGFPFLIGLVIYKWKRSHLSMGETWKSSCKVKTTLPQ